MDEQEYDLTVPANRDQGIGFAMNLRDGGGDN